MVARQTAQTYSFAGLLAAHRERKVHPKPADYDLSCEGGFVPYPVIPQCCCQSEPTAGPDGAVWARERRLCQRERNKQPCPLCCRVRLVRFYSELFDS
jgi:hypothetical protein